jgi:IclR family transcriptional regulator, acetate operon repressor
MVNSQRPATLIRSVSRASQLLLHVAMAPAGLAATEAAALLGTPVPTAYHLLNTLRVEGLLAKDDRRRFVLGPRIAVLADAWSRGDLVPPSLLEALHALAADTGETAYLAAWREDAIQALASVEGFRAVRVAEAERGPYRHPHARATGKLLLAHIDPARRARVLGDGPLQPATPSTITDRAALERELDAIRAQGWAEDREEFFEGVCCMAAPVMADGVVIAALTVSCPTQRFDRDREALRKAVLNAGRVAGAGVTPSIPQEAA